MFWQIQEMTDRKQAKSAWHRNEDEWKEGWERYWGRDKERQKMRKGETRDKQTDKNRTIEKLTVDKGRKMLIGVLEIHAKSR